jgi:hypothetical protein
VIDRRTRLPFAALLASIALFAFASFQPHLRLWGVNHLAFHTAAVRYAALGIVLAALLPAVSRALDRWILPPATPEYRRTIILVGALVGLGLFLWLHAATLLLGDGVLVVNNFEATAELGLGAAAYLRGIFARRLPYPGTEMINFLASTLARPVAGGDFAAGVRWLNAFLGAGLVAALLAFSSGAAGSRWMAVSAAVALTSGALLLFFGYVESYAPALAVGTLYVMSAYRNLRGKGQPWSPVILFVVGVVLHVQTLLFAPSLAYLFGRRLLGRRAGPAILIATAAGALVVTSLPIARSHLLRPFDAASGLFSPAHLADVANIVLLLVPAGLVWLALAFVPTRHSRARDWTTPAGMLTACLLLPCALFVLFFKPTLGLWRDWDLYAFTALGFVPAATFGMRRFLTDPAFAGDRARIVMPALVLSAVVTLAWVTINADAERSVARFESVLRYDHTALGYANESLARYFEGTGQWGRAADAMDRAYAFRPNLRFLVKASTLRAMAGDTLAAIAGLRAVLERSPSHDGARIQLLDILMSRQALDELLEVSRGGMEASPNHFMYPYVYGRALIAAGRFEEGARYFARARALDPPPAIAEDMTAILESIGRP